MKSYGLVIAIIVLLSGCNTPNDKQTSIEKNQWSPKYAKGFSFEKKDGITYLNIKNPWPGSIYTQQFALISKEKDLKKASTAIKIPLKRWATSSTSHVGFAQELDEINSLKAISRTSYVSSKDVQNRIENNEIRELGQANQPDVEWMISNQIEAFFNFSIGDNSAEFTVLEKAGVPVIYIGEWSEQHPLARAEWIKVFGLLFDKQKQADSIFLKIEEDYLQWSERAKTQDTSPKIISGSLYNGIWYAPQKDSYMQKFYEDAHLDYIWKDLEYTGSLQLDMEFVFGTAKNASIWLNSSEFQSIEPLMKLHPLIPKLSAVQKNKVYNTLKTNSSEGVLFYEKGVVRPDLVLKDLIQIGHPQLFKDHKLQFFAKLDR